MRRAFEVAGEVAYPGTRPAELNEALRTLWEENARYLRLAPPAQVARLAWTLLQCQANAGFFLDLIEPPPGSKQSPTVLFAMASPPPRGYLMQVIEAMNSLDIGVRRAMALSADAAGQRYFVASFTADHRQGKPFTRDSELFQAARRQIFATQILSVEGPTYREFVLPRLMAADEAGLVNALIGFCHTQCAHHQTDRYTLEDVVRAFLSHPEMSLRLVRLFKTRFAPGLADREASWAAQLAEVEHEVAAHNTGHRHLDEFRRSIFRWRSPSSSTRSRPTSSCDEKQALAFRLDPAYLAELGPAFTADLPPATPFRVTFFFGRYGFGYHIGFSDIARGGWRTVICRDRRRLRHQRQPRSSARTSCWPTPSTSRTRTSTRAAPSWWCCWTPPALADAERDQETSLLHKLQRGVINAFLDIFVTEDGVATRPARWSTTTARTSPSSSAPTRTCTT